ncbi:hypothetical protein TrVGV298_004539 [Trichoderma virens]|nr:hypothetical protein TrVGV298_004539 [Trichoderma virens]
MVTVIVSTLTVAPSASSSGSNATVVESTITKTLSLSTAGSQTQSTSNETQTVTTIFQTVPGPTTATRWINTTVMATEHGPSQTGSVIITTLYQNSTTTTAPYSYPYPLPTTFETSTTAKDHESGSRGFAYPVPTVQVQEEELPPNPSYPWGASSPLHRHQNVTGFGEGLLVRGSELVDWGRTAANRLRALLTKHVEGGEGEGEE